MTPLRRHLTATSLAILSVLAASLSASAGRLSVLYQATSDDGNAGSSLYQPVPVAGGGIIVEAQGAAGSYGLILLLTPNGQGQPYTRTVLHNFTQPCSTDGGGPTGHLAVDKAGNVWGMTNSSCGVPGGTVFELVNPGQGGSWTYNEVLQMPDLTPRTSPAAAMTTFCSTGKATSMDCCAPPAKARAAPSLKFRLLLLAAAMSPCRRSTHFLRAAMKPHSPRVSYAMRPAICLARRSSEVARRLGRSGRSVRLQRSMAAGRDQ